jgi:hypothetical protein
MRPRRRYNQKHLVSQFEQSHKPYRAAILPNLFVLPSSAQSDSAAATMAEQNMLEQQNAGSRRNRVEKQIAELVRN